MNPFEYLGAITATKKNIMEDDIDEKGYNAFIVNRSLSYFPDTVLLANEMNVNHHIDSRLQFDFFLNIVKKRKRFSKWTKASDIENLEVIKEYYGYSNEKAKSVYNLLSKSQVQMLKSKLYKGGKNVN